MSTQSVNSFQDVGFWHGEFGQLTLSLSWQVVTFANRMSSEATKHKKLFSSFGIVPRQPSGLVIGAGTIGTDSFVHPSVTLVEQTAQQVEAQPDCGPGSEIGTG